MNKSTNILNVSLIYNLVLQFTKVTITLNQPDLFSFSSSFPQGPVGGVEEVPPFQPQVYTYVCDVGKRESVYSTAEKVRREVGEVDILINNAGVVSGHHLLECPDELIERTMVVNCHAHFWVS